jgi:tRNA (cmo5U34)-methyltransferase
MPKDETVPEGKWKFDGDVAEVFDDMLARSIPQYEVMRQACFDLACHYQQEETDIVDLGCSRGGAMAQLVEKYGAHNHFVGIEVSPAMLEAVRARFKGLIDCGVVDIKDHDLREGLPYVKASVILSVLTIQFTPIEYRLKIISDVFKSLEPGGAFILVEKVLGASAELDEVMIDLYYDMKREHGYTEDQIQRKRLSLEGVLVPVTAKWNEELLRMAGFQQVDCFWRWCNFAGWLAVKS